MKGAIGCLHFQQKSTKLQLQKRKMWRLCLTNTLSGQPESSRTVLHSAATSFYVGDKDGYLRLTNLNIQSLEEFYTHSITKDYFTNRWNIWSEMTSRLLSTSLFFNVNANLRYLNWEDALVCWEWTLLSMWCKMCYSYSVQVWTRGNVFQDILWED